MKEKGQHMVQYLKENYCGFIGHANGQRTMSEAPRNMSNQKYLKMLIVLWGIVDGREFNPECGRKSVYVIIICPNPCQTMWSKRSVAIGDCNLWGLSISMYVFSNYIFFHLITNGFLMWRVLVPLLFFFFFNVSHLFLHFFMN